MSWPATAEAIMDAMTASGVPVARKVIGPGPAIGRRCRQFTVYPTLVSTSPGSRACTTVGLTAFAAVFTADCFPLPGDQAEQYPDEIMTARTLEHLAECEAVWNAVVDGAASFGEGCDSVEIGAASFAGPSGGLASMTMTIVVHPLSPF